MKPLPPGTRQKAFAFRPYGLIVAALAMGLSATGCGNRGPLYLPDAPEPVTTTDTSAQADAKAEEEDDEEGALPNG